MDYQHYLNKDIWRIQEACYLLAGFDPKLTPDDPDGKIEKINDLLEASLLAGKLKRRILGKYYTGNDYGYEPKIIIEWAISKQIEIPEQLQNYHQPTTPTTPTITHTSELLEIMQHCIAETWENHDPKRPPSNELINQWFDDTPWYFFGYTDYTQNDFDGNPLMHSELRHQQFSQLYHTTPAIQLGGITIKWLTESMAALEKIFTNINKITTPTLVIQAGSDKIVNNQAQDDFCQQLHQLHPQTCPNGKPLLVKDAYHELFFESDVYRLQTLTAVVEWFEKH